jgi:transcriptional regulator with XRE-family HTH domain
MPAAPGGHDGSVQRQQLADFLRRRRAGLTTRELGLPEGTRRRTPGLRREEVAGATQISTDYYIRLEQGRGPHPSPEVLAALARALRLTDDERTHLFLLAGKAPPRPEVLRTSVRPGVLHVLHALVDAPAFVTSDVGATLAQNPLARALVGDETTWRGLDAYVTWRWFTRPESRAIYPVEDHDHHGRVFTADLRATAGRRRGDRDVETLVAALLDASEEFRTLWAEHEVAVRRRDTKRVLNPLVGLVDVDCEVLLTPESGQSLVLLTPRPGTPARQRLELLAVLGTQALMPSADSAS